MQTIRGRLTVWYSAALVLTLAAFAIVLYVARRRASYEDLDQRIRSEAELSAAILGESYRARGALVTYDSTGKPALVADIKAVLEAVPDYLLITAQDGEILYSSSNASLTYQQVVQLRKLTPPPLSGRTAGTVRLEPDGCCEPASSADRKARRGCWSSEFIITAAVAASAPNATIAMPAAARSCEGSTSVRGEGGGGGFAAGFSVADAGRAIGAGFAAPAAASWSCRWTMAGSFVESAQERASPPSHPFRRRSATRAGSSWSTAKGFAVITSQNPHRRVHRSPRMRNVASRSSQHS